MFYTDEEEGKNYWRYVEFLTNSYNLLTFSSPSNTVEILDSITGKSLKSFQVEQDIVFLTGFSVSKNNNFLALSDFNNEFSIWDIEKEAPLRILGGRTFLVESDGEGEGDYAKVLFSDDSKFLIFGTAYSLNLLDIEKNKIINTISLVKANYYTRSLSLNKENTRLAVRYGGNNGEEIVILEFPSFQEVSRINIDENYNEIDELSDEETLGCEFYNENEILINNLNNSFLEKFIINQNKLIKSEFKVKSRNKIKHFKLNSDRTKIILITDPSGDEISGYINEAEIWDLETKKCLSTFQFEIEYGKISITGTYDNKLIAITSFTQTDENEYTLIVYDIDSDQCKHKFLKQKYK